MSTSDELSTRDPTNLEIPKVEYMHVCIRQWKHI
jgi:hypothetical protein